MLVEEWMRRFELVAGSSAKFWEVAVDAASVQVRYGRIGTNGQSQTKEFSTAAGAQAEGDRLVREKVGKGYVEVGTGTAVAIAPAVQPAVVAPQSADTPAEAAIAPAPAPLATLPEAMAADFKPEPQPPGQFLWTSRWQRLLPPLRGQEAPAVPPIDLERCRRAIDVRLGHLRERIAESQVAWVTSELAEFGFTPETVAAGIDFAALEAAADIAGWAKLGRRCAVAGRMAFRGGDDPLQLQHIWRYALAAHGLSFALQVSLKTVALAPSDTRRDHIDRGPGLAEMRERIVALPESEYLQLLAIAERGVGHSALLDCVIADLFPDEHGFVDAALESMEAEGDTYPLVLTLLGCALTENQAERIYETVCGPYGSEFTVARMAVLNLARLQLPRSIERTLAMARRQHSSEQRQAFYEIVRAYDSVDALRTLIGAIDDKDIRPIAELFARDWPQLAIRLAGERLLAEPSKLLREWLERFAGAHADALTAAHAASGGEVRSLLGKFIGDEPRMPEAPLDSLPQWLREPLWRQARRAAPAFAKLVPFHQVPAPTWANGERARWLGRHTPETALVGSRRSYRMMREEATRGARSIALETLGISNTVHELVLGGSALEADHFINCHSAQPEFLMLLPPPLAASVLTLRDPREWYSWDGGMQLEAVIAWLDELAVPGLEAMAERNAELGLRLAQPLASARVALVAVANLAQGKKARASAQRWLLRHAQVAATALLPLLGKGKQADEAAQALHWLLANERSAEVAAAAAQFGSAGQATLAILQGFDPMERFPSKLPKLPDFWMPAAYARPQLRDGRGLPLAVLDAVGEMLLFSTLESRYAGLDRLRALCAPASLGAFAWDLFESWLGAGAPPKELIALNALAHLGDDECARKLAAAIRTWPEAGHHKRAVTGLDVLAAIGSDVALMYLNGIAEKARHKPMQAHARTKIEELAEARGLSAVELADRLVPDLGLDASGSLTLDYGPRQFTVGFDEQLKPVVRDADGAVLRDLPKPGKNDDATLAEAAEATFKALKKNARALASQQLQRLELAMAQRRRWTAAEFRNFFVEHPLVRHLACRLLWARHEDAKPTAFLRVTTDASYADADDQALTLPEDAQIGLAHALELPAETAQAFARIFDDYELLQPFKQLGRECYTLTDEESAGSELSRDANRTVKATSIFSLEHRGWHRDDAESGMVGTMYLPLGPEHVVELGLDPGVSVENPMYTPTQKLGPLVLRRTDSTQAASWKEVDPILASEVLRDVGRLT